MRQTLAYFMNCYCRQFKTWINEEKNAIYEKYKVKSRSEMTEKQLQEAIESYKIALENNIK